MEMGVPSIISKQSGCAEILNNVIKTDYWDIDSMADAMHALVSYPALHNELREKGIEEIHGITWAYEARCFYVQTPTHHRRGGTLRSGAGGGPGAAQPACNKILSAT